MKYQKLFLTILFGFLVSTGMFNSAAAQDLGWAKGTGGTVIDFGSSIAVDGSGKSYVTGYFYGTGTFGAGESNETTLTSAGGIDVFVAKYDNSGALIWAKSAGGNLNDEAQGIAVDGSGNCYVTG